MHWVAMIFENTKLIDAQFDSSYAVTRLRGVKMEHLKVIYHIRFRSAELNQERHHDGLRKAAAESHKHIGGKQQRRLIAHMRRWLMSIRATIQPGGGVVVETSAEEESVT